MARRRFDRSAEVETVEDSAELARANASLSEEVAALRQANADLLQRNRELLSLQSAAAATSSSLDLQFVLETVTWEMANLLGIESCAVYEWNPDTNRIAVVAEYGSAGWWETGTEAKVYDLSANPFEERLLNERYALQMTASQPDIDPSGLAYLKESGIKSLLILPMVFQDRAVGLVKIRDRQEERTFSDYEISLAQALTSQAAGAIENARLYEQAKWEIAQRLLAEEKLEQYAAELERSNQELQQFAYVASHDLQEPLRMVTSYLQLLKQRYGGSLDSDADAFITFAVEGAKQMHQLIQGLLAYSRVGTHGGPFQRTDSQAILAKALANLELAIQESGAEVTSDPLPTVTADGMQMGQLLQNLIGNAIKFTRGRSPRIHVSAEQRDTGEEAAHWCFSIQDNGIGIARQHAERVFQIFQRLHTREECPGTGIGLALCKRIVERHGGRIWFESEPGQGTTFYFTLPEGSQDLDW
jgi:signal transduction histidine kinase